MPPYRLGIDIGGTFTDLALVDEGGAAAVVKVLSTPDDYARGVLEGVGQLLAQTGRAPGEVAEVVHGTTVATNTLLQRRGAHTGLLTTRGFRDVLEIRRMRVPRLYDLTWEKPPPLVARSLRLEVDERLDHTGRVLRPLDEGSARAAIQQLLDVGVEAIAVSLLHAYANPAHEQQLGALLQELAPDLFCALSHEVLPQIKEYERTSTTVINAYLGPAVGRYLQHMEEGLAALGIRAPLLVMQSNGGSMTAAAARRLPAQLVESGPAAGALAAAAMGRQVDETRLLSLDMGGTTAKATFILDGVVPLALEAEIGAGVMVANRLNRGGGYLLSLPSIDLVEVGAGGGSLVWIGVPGQDSRTDIRADIRPVSETTGPRGRDAGGVLCVGPQSAGAAPGPACYAAGGTAPTLTDANVVLGYLNPHHLLGGELRLDAEAARCAVTEQVADPLGLSVEAAAYGAHAIAVASMVWAVRAVSAERGHDPRAAALVAFGGNGPLHAAAVAQELGIPRVLVPPSPGVFSAFGLLAAEVEHHFLHTHLRRLDQLEELSAVRNVASGMAETALATLGAEGYHPESVELRWAADLRYLGQSFELTVAVAQPLHSAFDTEVVAALERAFGAAHERTYGHSAPGEPVELVNLRLVARGRSAAPRGLPRHAAVEDSDARERRTRRAYFGADGGWQETPVLERGALAGAAQAGPLIVEEYDATTLVPPGWQARLGAQGSIVLERLAA